MERHLSDTAKTLLMDRRGFLAGVTGGIALIAGCSSSEGGSTRRVTVPSLSLVNHEPRAVTVSVILTDPSDEVHLWKTVELDARAGESEGGTVDVHEFESTWLEPREYQLLLNWREADETRSAPVADLPMVDECAPLVVRIDDGFQFSVTIESCPDPE